LHATVIAQAPKRAPRVPAMVANQFVSSPQMLRLKIRNNTSKPIGSFELTIQGVEKLHDIGIDSDLFSPSTFALAFADFRG
jgi:hypothetical protein